MARPKTPTNILELRNSFQAHPESRNKKEPKVNAPLDLEPPGSFNESQCFYFHDVVRRAPSGILGDADFHTVCMIAALLAQFYDSPDDMDTARMTRLSSELGKIGFTPSSRAGLMIDKPTKNKFADD